MCLSWRLVGCVCYARLFFFAISTDFVKGLSGNEGTLCRWEGQDDGQNEDYFRKRRRAHLL